MADFNTLLNIARRKRDFDRTNPWYEGPETYLHAIGNEVDEVLDELEQGKLHDLEAELGDVLWNTLNAVLALEKTHGVSLSSILERTNRKYDERVTGIEKGISWEDIKKQQQEASDSPEGLT